MARRYFLRCFGVLAMLSGVDACMAARTGELVVREGDAGVPCFTIAEAEEARAGAPHFDAITVSEVGGGAKGVHWHMEMPASRTFTVSFRMCVPYAGRLSVLPQVAALPLAAGKLYEVAIRARAPQPAAAPRAYRARFCLVEGGKGLRLGSPRAGSAKSPPSCAPV